MRGAADRSHLRGCQPELDHAATAGARIRTGRSASRACWKPASCSSVRPVRSMMAGQWKAGTESLSIHFWQVMRSCPRSAAMAVAEPSQWSNTG